MKGGVLIQICRKIGDLQFYFRDKGPQPYRNPTFANNAFFSIYGKVPYLTLFPFLKLRPPLNVPLLRGNALKSLHISISRFRLNFALIVNKPFQKLVQYAGTPAQA